VLVAVVVCFASSSLSRSARAEWLPGSSRAIPLFTSIAPDAPVTALHYGPRASAQLGADVGVLALHGTSTTFRLGASGFIAVDNATARGPLPDEVGRSGFELGAAWSLDALGRRWLGEEGILEIGVAIGRRSAFALSGYDFADRYRPDGVPFGAGGWFLGIDLAASTRAAPDWTLWTRVGGRAFANALPDAVGQTEASDNVADFLLEGAEASATLEAGTRWRATSWAEPVAGLYGEILSPHDDSARMRWLVRALAGVAAPGKTAELVPFLDAEAGRGQGLLVNRTELRLGVGVRLHAR
jgi:hypothetical protein